MKKKGGTGECKFCGEIFNNVSHHMSRCDENPKSPQNRERKRSSNYKSEFRSGVYDNASENDDS